MAEDSPSFGTVLRAVGRCALATASLLARRRLALPLDWVGAKLHFADGTTSMVFRETAVRCPPPDDPVVLVVRFRLRLVGSRRLPQEVFRRTCIVNTPLFAGFPGFHTKLWLTDTATGTYRGLYEWQGAQAASHYARTLRQVLALVSVRGSIDHQVLPGRRREDYLRAVRSTPIPRRRSGTHGGDWPSPSPSRRAASARARQGISAVAGRALVLFAADADLPSFEMHGFRAMTPRRAK